MNSGQPTNEIMPHVKSLNYQDSHKNDTCHKSHKAMRHRQMKKAMWQRHNKRLTCKVLIKCKTTIKFKFEFKFKICN